MKRSLMAALAVLFVAGAVHCGADHAGRERAEPAEDHAARDMPEPAEKGEMSLEEAIAERRSVRHFLPGELTQEQVAQLAWAAQGVTCHARGFRASPSAGALYPMELYVVTADGILHYQPAEHAFREHKPGDQRAALTRAALGQRFIAEAPVTLVVAAVYERVTRRYGERGNMYVHMEAGHIGQNILLQAVSLGLGSVPVGAFGEDAVRDILSLPDEEVPLYLLPVGHPAE